MEGRDEERSKKKATKQLTTVVGFQMPQATSTLDYAGGTDPDSFVCLSPFC